MKRASLSRVWVSCPFAQPARSVSGSAAGTVFLCPRSRPPLLFLIQQSGFRPMEGPENVQMADAACLPSGACALRGKQKYRETIMCSVWEPQSQPLHRDVCALRGREGFRKRCLCKGTWKGTGFPGRQSRGGMIKCKGVMVWLGFHLGNKKALPENGLCFG